MTNLFLSLQVYGFFKGLAFPLAAVGLLNSIFFGVYGLTLRVLSTGRNREEKGIPYYRDIFIAGAFAGAVQAIPACPIELVKVRLQVQKGGSKVKVKYLRRRLLLKCHAI
ncbi:hypothetical protein NP493_5593g00003 [Ridgeia piscesae]|uniref:Uncharacterized protein n=1 Tax=Ridgeia piscesae TaxID=27915 RepID=A0AAD9MQV9_RIDPI|nr:hypothetical protein NP493_5593g00003 [Ridgeia piscesae]